MASRHDHQDKSAQDAGKPHHYVRLFGMTALSFISMYMLMYAMVDSPDEICNSFNQAYMAGLMMAPMVLIELVLMSGMYHNKRLNALLMGVSVVVGILCFALIRQQTLISDRQFLRSMIPHHSGAILMCREANVHDQRIQELCKTIISSQRAEIDQMQKLLDER